MARPKLKHVAGLRMSLPYLVIRQRPGRQDAAIGVILQRKSVVTFKKRRPFLFIEIEVSADIDIRFLHIRTRLSKCERQSVNSSHQFVKMPRSTPYHLEPCLLWVQESFCLGCRRTGSASD